MVNGQVAQRGGERDLGTGAGQVRQVFLAALHRGVLADGQIVELPGALQRELLHSQADRRDFPDWLGDLALLDLFHVRSQVLEGGDYLSEEADVLGQVGDLYGNSRCGGMS
ncbi:hypothetical protein [Streptomyces flavidovirens]